MSSESGGYFWGTGRRKTSVARVRIKEGKGQFFINDRTLNAFFPIVNHRDMVLLPLQITNTADKCDVFVNVRGGGVSGQAGAIVLGIARALYKLFPIAEDKLRGQGLLTRDGRMKERKKYGRRKARARYQFSKR